MTYADSKSLESMEIVVYGRDNRVLDSLWEDKNHGRCMDTKLVYQDGALLCHRLPFILASPLLAKEITEGHASVVHLPYVSLVEAHYFLKVIYGQSFSMPAIRVPRMNMILENYGIEELECCLSSIREREECSLPSLPDDINKQIILPPHDFVLDDSGLLAVCAER